MNGDDISPIEDELIESNGEISQALVEIKYAKENGLLEGTSMRLRR